jgi:single-stranded DNA-binding protein
MIDALIAGRLCSRPEERTSKNGRVYVTARLLASTGEERLYASLIAFDENACRALLALDEGESVAVSGELRPKIYEARDGSAKLGLDVTAHAVLSAYSVRRRRQAAQSPTPAAEPAVDDFGDDPAVIR